MTDQPAASHGPASGHTGTAPGAPVTAEPIGPAAAAGGTEEPPTAGSPVDDTPPGADPPPADGPPGGSRMTSRYGLVRPRQGRYVAGVCAAIGGATNTDPVLWRVLLAVLGFFGGIGILVYLAAWLIIPAEGDTASPVEAMLGRGRSSMSPVTVLILGVLVAVMFGFIVTDVFRAALLGAAILVGGALLLNRNGAGPQPVSGAPTTAAPPPATDPPVPGTPDAGSAVTTEIPLADEAATTADKAVATADVPARPDAPTRSDEPTSLGAPPAGAAPVSSPTLPLPPVTGALPAPPPAGGYRPPFAPHGPYAGSSGYPSAYPLAVAPPTPRRPKPPKQRSPLGAATFSLTFVVIGLIAVLDLTGVAPVWPSTYFAGALLTIALGLLVGAWFGRARWLIALGIVAATGLGVSALAEGLNGVRPTGDVVWQPGNVRAMAESYETQLGDATLDLRQVDFAGANEEVTVVLRAGKVHVWVPPRVDVTTNIDLRAGDAIVFGQKWSAVGDRSREVTDTGIDGRGGGTLRLFVELGVGEVEVRR